jgi:hypothetical protein
LIISHPKDAKMVRLDLKFHRDGAGDACDNCPVTNPDQRDDDGNRIGDVCDQLVEFLDHTHTYLTGTGEGHNNTEAETGEAEVQAD